MSDDGDGEVHDEDENEEEDKDEDDEDDNNDDDEDEEDHDADDPKTRKHSLCEPAQSKRTWTFQKSQFVLKFIGKRPDPNSGAHVLCAPAQSKPTWTFHKSHSVWTFIGKMQDPAVNTSIEHQALTLTVRTLQLGHAVWGMTKNDHYPDKRPQTMLRVEFGQRHRIMRAHI